jgi:type VI secretion system VasD/TssJ family lipoprotein
MRTFRMPPGRLTAAILVLGVSLLAGLVSCAKVPLVGGEPTITLDLTAGAMCNSCGKSEPHSLWFRVLQVLDATALSGASPGQVWDHEADLLGSALLNDPKQSEGVIDPGEQGKRFVFERDPKAKAVVFIGNFCETRGGCWYHVKPLKGKGGARLDLFVDNFCVSVRR